MNRITIAVACLGISLSATAEESVRTFPALKIEVVEIEAEAGDVIVRGVTAEDIKVEVAKFDPAKCALAMEPAGKTLKLSVKTKNRAAWSTGCQAGFVLGAPERIKLGLSVGSGNVNVIGRKASINVDLGSGDATFERLSGEVKARLGSGDVKGRVSAHNMDLRVGSGNIDLAWSEKIEDGRIDIKSGSGDVVLRFPKNTQMRADMSTASGSVRRDLPNDQNARLAVSIQSGSGDIRIAESR